MRAVVLLLCVAGTALANPKAAEVHNRQAKAYFEATQYDAAIAEFKKSYELDKKPLTLFKIASAYYAKADWELAIDFYGQYLQADPQGPYSAQALEFTTLARKAKDEAQAKIDAQAKEAELQKKRAAAAGHIKNAEALAKENAWSSAGDEYRAATVAGGDPAHLLEAARAYRKGGAYAKSREAYLEYFDKAVVASEQARKELAETTRVLEEEQAKKKQVAVAQPPQPERRDEPETMPPISRGWSSYGLRAMFGVMQADTNPYKTSSSDGLIFQPSFEVGGFARYQLTTQIALRPEAAIAYRSAGFDGDIPGGMMTENNVVGVKRAGLAFALPVFFSVSDSDRGFRLGAGPYVALMPYLSGEKKAAYPPVGDTTLFDYGVLAGIEIDFGRISLELRFIKGFGKLAENVDATSYTLLGGLAVGFDVAH